MNLTSCWIEKQERSLCFSQVTQISSFISSSKNKEDEKVRPSVDFTEVSTSSHRILVIQ
jgi:hypothetical protein